MLSILVMVLILVVTFLMLAFFVLSIISEFNGAPYVGTSSKLIDEILKTAKLKKGQFFIELGSGDGRVVMSAVAKYQVKGLGIDSHYLLVAWSIVHTKLKGLSNISFKSGNFFKANLGPADVLFLFLMPKTITKLAPKILAECKPGTLIICHGFRYKSLDKYLIKTIPRKVFSTYYYKL